MALLIIWNGIFLLLCTVISCQDHIVSIRYPMPCWIPTYFLLLHVHTHRCTCIYVHTYIGETIFQRGFCCLMPLYFPLTDPAVSAAVWCLRKCGLASWYSLVPTPSFGSWSGPLWVDRAQYCYCSSDMIAFKSLGFFFSFIRLRPCAEAVDCCRRLAPSKGNSGKMLPLKEML